MTLKHIKNVVRYGVTHQIVIKYGNYMFILDYRYLNDIIEGLYISANNKHIQDYRPFKETPFYTLTDEYAKYILDHYIHKKWIIHLVKAN